MLKKLAYLFYKIILLFDYIFKKINKEYFSNYIYDFLRESFETVFINGKLVKFFTPSSTSLFRVRGLFSKEPETIKWIDNFKKNEEIIFWDIGANIGLYSIYAALKHEKIKIIAFEPSTKNLNLLSRNIDINHLSEKIIIGQLALTSKPNQIALMSEKSVVEASASNSFGVSYGFDGKAFIKASKYNLMGDSIDNLLNKNFLKIPDYIKIDVDGIEHLILEGAQLNLANKKIKSIIIEVQEDLTEQTEKIINILKKSNFHLSNKHRDLRHESKSKFSSQYMYIFDKK